MSGHLDRTRTAIAGLALVGVVVLACQDGTTEPDRPELPKSGTIRLGLDTPNPDDRAVRLTLSGPIADVQAAQGFTAFTSTAGTTTTLILVREGGASIPPGGLTVAAITVKPGEGQFSVELDEVATRSYAVRESLDGYSLSLQLE